MNVPFEVFFEAIWGYPPYPWQTELSRVVAAEGWPKVLDLPTGSGKTAVLDIALHNLATDGGTTAPRRILMVVDRRVIVDQVGVRAQRILSALRGSAGTDGERSPEMAAALRDTRTALRMLVGEGAPLLRTEVLRGGMVRRDAWAEYPHVPVLAGSTVDQIGSRLFFRGYGVSDRMQSVHAGLIGCDTLLFLDEVHLAQPFAEVLGQLSQLRERERTGEIPNRFGVVQLSATPGKAMIAASASGVSGDPDSGRAEIAVSNERPGRRDVFRILDEDRTNERLARVLRAHKPATLAMVDVKARSHDDVKRRAIAEAAAKHAREMVHEGRKAVAVVVNRVDTARRTWTLLQNREFDAILVTGRMRPLDQEAVLARIGDRVIAGRARDPEARPIVVVATQCIEAGADYDFDGLVTECAPLDALRQRFGRLDRRGEYAEQASESSRTASQIDAFAGDEMRSMPYDASRMPSARAVILMRSDLLGSVVDPVYGESLLKTWEWLNELAAGDTVDFGIDIMEHFLGSLREPIEKLLAPHRDAPVLLPAYLEQWAQTNPKPYADPDVSLFLHGIPADARSALADVQVVWRSDLTENPTDGSAGALKPGKVLFEHLAMVPPGSSEAISLPVWSVKQWLAGDAQVRDYDDDVADVEGVAGTSDVESSQPRNVILWRGREKSKIIDASEIPPGAMIVVPESYGGIGNHGTFDPAALFNPEAIGERPIYDLGDIVQLRQRGNPTIRLDPRVLGQFVGTEFAMLLPNPGDEDVDINSSLRDALTVLRETALGSQRHWIGEILDAVGPRPRFFNSPASSWIVLGHRLRSRGDSATSLEPDPSWEVDPASIVDPTGDGSEENESFTGDPNSDLFGHLSEVAALAESFARHAGLPPKVIASIKWAAKLHDIGKADPKFQTWLHGGDEISARFATSLLAKSDIPWQDTGAMREARERSGYPYGQRHELVSLALIERSHELRDQVESDGADWELVLHLVASHHGWCRPLAPMTAVADDNDYRVDFNLDGIQLSGAAAHGRGRLDSGIAERFWVLNRMYGRHELAFLEGVLRLADHRCSERRGK